MEGWVVLIFEAFVKLGTSHVELLSLSPSMITVVVSIIKIDQREDGMLDI